MIDREKVIKGLEQFKADFKPFCGNGSDWARVDAAISLLKEQEGYVSVPFSWLVKFCTHIDFMEPLTDAEREAAWRKKLWQQFNINALEKAVE